LSAGLLWWDNERQSGAGNSTLLLQLMCRLSQDMETLYITGEESLQQIGMRARRLGLPSDKLKMLAETDIREITRAIDKTPVRRSETRAHGGR